MKKCFLAAFALLALMMLAVPSSAMASSNGPTAGPEVRCGDFSNGQGAAQAYFDANGQPWWLDQNGDGLACASFDDGDFVPAGYDPANLAITCDSFASDLEAAQAYYEANMFPVQLDVNQNGIACDAPEDRDYGSLPSAGFDDSTGPSAWPEWTCNDFPEGPEAAAEYFATNGGPATLDPDGDGTACEQGDDYAADSTDPSTRPNEVNDEADAAVSPENVDLAGAEDEATTDDATVSDATVTQLPTTGTGVLSAQSQAIVLMLAAIAVALLIASVASANGSRR